MPEMIEILAEGVSDDVKKGKEGSVTELSKVENGRENVDFDRMLKYEFFYQDSNEALAEKCTSIRDMLNEDPFVFSVVDTHWDQMVVGYPHFVLHKFFTDANNVIVTVEDGTTKKITLTKMSNELYHLTIAVAQFPLKDRSNPEKNIGTVPGTIAVTWLVDTANTKMSFYSLQTDMLAIRDFLTASARKTQVNLTAFFEPLKLSQSTEKVIRHLTFVRRLSLQDKNRSHKNQECLADLICRNLTGGSLQQQMNLFFKDNPVPVHTAKATIIKCLKDLEETNPDAYDDFKKYAFNDSLFSLLFELLTADYLSDGERKVIAPPTEDQKRFVDLCAHTRINIGYDVDEKCIFLHARMNEARLVIRDLLEEEEPERDECKIEGSATVWIYFTGSGLKFAFDATSRFFEDAINGRLQPKSQDEAFIKIKSSNHEFNQKKLLAKQAAEAVVALRTALEDRIKRCSLRSDTQPYKNALGQIFYKDKRYSQNDNDLCVEYQNITKAANDQNVDIDELKRHLSTIRDKIIVALGNDCCRKALKDKGVNNAWNKALIVLTAVSLIGVPLLLFRYFRPNTAQADKRDWTMTKTQSIFWNSHSQAVSRVRNTMWSLSKEASAASAA